MRMIVLVVVIVAMSCGFIAQILSSQVSNTSIRSPSRGEPT